MRASFLRFVGIWVVAAIVLAGCGRVGGPPGYIDSLASGDPDRVIGKYPGLPDNDGMIVVRVVGKGIPPENAVNKGQSIILAERAAVADGYRQLAERIKGIYVQAYTKLGGESVDYDRINLETATWLRGAKVMKTEQLEYGITAVHMEANVHIAPDHLPNNRYPRKRSGASGQKPPMRWWPW